MKFAVNYTPLLAEMVQARTIAIDLFKCPAWPDLLADARRTLPVYIHLPITVGSGRGAVNDERKAPLDLPWLDDLLAATGTPFINTHWVANGADFPAIPVSSTDTALAQPLLDAAQRDLQPLIERYGAERVIVENLINQRGWMSLSALPEVFHTLLERTGCGFLFDLSHARLAAENLGLDERAYCAAMPVDRIREIHVTGLQRLEGALLEQVIACGDPYNFVAHFAGRKIDHLPMTEVDWPELAWAMGEIHAGRWAAPWVVSYEYGGVGKFWEEMTSAEVYTAQLPRMAELVAGTTEMTA